MAAGVSEPLKGLLEWGFVNVLDVDKSGFIEQREAGMVAKYLGLGGPGKDVTALWQDMLKDMDSDGDGKISRDEYVAFMAKKFEMYADGGVERATNLKQELADKKNQQAHLLAAVEAELDDVEEMDLDGNVVAPAAPPAPPAPLAEVAEDAAKKPAIAPAKLKELKALFERLDEDKSGQLSKDEIQDCLLLDDETLASLWAKADTDGDGQVTFDEFVKAADAFEAAEAELDADMPGLP